MILCFAGVAGKTLSCSVIQCIYIIYVYVCMCAGKSSVLQSINYSVHVYHICVCMHVCRQKQCVAEHPQEHVPAPGKHARRRFNSIRTTRSLGAGGMGTLSITMTVQAHSFICSPVTHSYACFTFKGQDLQLPLFRGHAEDNVLGFLFYKFASCSHSAQSW